MSLFAPCSRGCRLPEIRPLAEGLAGKGWWRAQNTPELELAAVVTARRQGFCDRHAGMIGDLVGALARVERRNRDIRPGTVEVRMVDINAEPYELLTSGEARREARNVVDLVTTFVRDTSLSALIEIDRMAKRARVTFTLHELDEPQHTVIESNRLVHFSARELADSLRRRAALSQVL